MAEDNIIEKLVMDALNDLIKEKKVNITSKVIRMYIYSKSGTQVDVHSIGDYLRKNGIKRKHTNYGNVVSDDGVINIKSKYRRNMLKLKPSKLKERIDIFVNENNIHHFRESSEAKYWKLTDKKESLVCKDGILTKVRRMMERNGIQVEPTYEDKGKYVTNIGGVTVKISAVSHERFWEPNILRIYIEDYSKDKLNNKIDIVKTNLKEWDAKTDESCSVFCIRHE